MTIKIAVLGCGSIARYRHAPEYSANKNCVIAAFYDLVHERAKDLARQYGGKAVSCYDEILKDPSIDAVSICTPNYLHGQMTIKALNAGKHVLCEKPMAISLQEASEMVRTARDGKRILMIAHNQRLTLTHRKAKEILQRGDLGAVMTFGTCFKHAGPESWSIDQGKHIWFFNKDNAHFGVLGDLGIHKIDLIRWLLGEDIIEVSALLHTSDKRDDNGNLIDLEDNALCLLKTSGGKVGTMEVSWSNYGMEDNSTVLYCEKGVMKVYADPVYDLVLEFADGSAEYHKISAVYTNKQQKEFRHCNSGVVDSFISCIVKNQPAEIPGEEGWNSLAVVIACGESAKTRKHICVGKYCQ